MHKGIGDYFFSRGSRAGCPAGSPSTPC
jgi:hypothetical protein